MDVRVPEPFTEPPQVIEAPVDAATRPPTVVTLRLPLEATDTLLCPFLGQVPEAPT